MAKVEIETDELGMSVEQFGAAVSDLADTDVKLVVSAFGEKEQLVDTVPDGGQKLLLETGQKFDQVVENSDNYESEYDPMPDYSPIEGSPRNEILLHMSGKGFVDTATIAQRTNSKSKTVANFTSAVPELFHKRSGSSTNGSRMVYKLTEKGENLAQFVRNHGRGPIHIDPDAEGTLRVYKSLYRADKPLLTREIGTDLPTQRVSRILLDGEKAQVISREQSEHDPNIYVSELTDIGKESLEVVLSSR